MMVYEGPESACGENFGEFMYQFKIEIRTFAGKLERDMYLYHSTKLL